MPLAVGTTHGRLERGRDQHPSPHVLDALREPPQFEEDAMRSAVADGIPLRRCYRRCLTTSLMLRSLPAVLITLLGTALAVAACGSSSTPKTTASSGTQAVAYVRCMRSHGVSNMPDAGEAGGIQLPADINPYSPAFESALTRCARLMPTAAGGARSAPSQHAIQQLLALSRCMRAHGMAEFPDPTLSRPPSDPQGYSIAFGRGGVSLLVPSTVDVSSPAFKQAAVACHFEATLPKGQRTPISSS